MKVVDMHCDTLYEMEKNHLSLSENNLNIDIKKMEEGDYLLQNFAIFTELKETADPVDHVMKCIDYFYQEMRKNKDKIQPVTTYDEIMDNSHNGVMSALLTIEEGAVIHEDLSYLRNYYRLGVRMVALSWNHINGLTYPNFDMNDDTHGYHTCDNEHGLTDAGKAYIKEMEDLGMIIDVSHMSDDELSDIRNVEIGFIFQGFNLIANLTALENVELPLIYRGVGKKERRELAEAALEKVGLGQRMSHKPSEMSGGQQQRVAIARAIAQAPPVILADEPTGNLDSGSTKEIMSILKQLHREGRTVILITHDNDIAAQARRVIRIKDGKIEADFEQQVEDW